MQVIKHPDEFHAEQTFPFTLINFNGLYKKIFFFCLGWSDNLALQTDINGRILV